MARGTGKIIGGIITLIIGGTVYSISQRDVVKNFSEETGLSEEEAEQYIESIPDDELVSFEEIGWGLITEGQDILGMVQEIDCVNYYYDWESEALSCEEGKSQLKIFGEDEIALGEAYKFLSSDSASTTDIQAVIELIDKNNENYSLEIISRLVDDSDIDESIKTNLYNKALLQTALDNK